MSDEPEPGLVSVIVPTFNRAGLIGETLRSVLAQTYRPIEIVVVDDGSTDCTREVVERFVGEADPGLHVRYVAQENLGVSAARNRGLAESRGEFIQYLDSDDLMNPHKLQLQVEALARRPGLDFVYSASATFVSRPEDAAAPCTGLRASDHLVACIRRSPFSWCTDSGLYRRGLCESIGPWDESLCCWEDWEYHCRTCLAAKSIGHVQGVLSHVRMGCHRRVTGTQSTRPLLDAGAVAIGKVHAALLRHRRLRCLTVSNALAVAYLHMARRAAAEGAIALSSYLTRQGRLLPRSGWARVLDTLWDAGVSLLGWRRAGHFLGFFLGRTRQVRRLVTRLLADLSTGEAVWRGDR
jgi:hypothetical protein